jgi:hypothetical protein
MAFRLLPTQTSYTVASIDRCCWVTIIGCENGHAVSWTGPDMVERFPLAVTITDIAARLKCGTCGSTEGRIGFVQERSERARQRMARRTPGPPGVYRRK